MPSRSSLKSRVLDDIDRKILRLLQENGRESLTNIAKTVNLSIDAVRKRVDEMMNKGVFRSGIFINPQIIGYDISSYVTIRLHHISAKEKEDFLSGLYEHANVISVYSVIGSGDVCIMLVGKDAKDLENTSVELRDQYSSFIRDWNALIISQTHKQERYALDD